MSTIKVDTIATRTGSGNITVSNNIAGAGTISGTNLTASGTLGVTGNTTVGGTLVNTGLITASAGVAIGGTGAANTLDDYEKGDWTPALYVAGSAPSGISYNYREGRYRKVGSVCHVHWRLEINGKGSTSSGAMTITGLPFSISQNYPIGVLGCQTGSSAHTNFPAQADCQGLWALGAGTVVYLRYNSTTGYGDWNYSYVPSSGTNIWGSMTFNCT